VSRWRVLREEKRDEGVIERRMEWASASLAACPPVRMLPAPAPLPPPREISARVPSRRERRAGLRGPLGESDGRGCAGRGRGVRRRALLSTASSGWAGRALHVRRGTGLSRRRALCRTSRQSSACASFLCLRAAKPRRTRDARPACSAQCAGVDACMCC